MDWLGVDRHRLGTALLVFGVVGMVLAVVVAAGLVGGAIAARNLDDRLASDQARLVGMLDRLTVTIDRLADSTDHAASTVATTRDLVTEAGGLLTDIAATTNDLADALDISILGSQPFSRAAGELRSLAGRVDPFAQKTTTLAANLDANVTDLADLAARTRQIGDDVASVSARLTAFDRTSEVVSLIVGGILLGGFLVAWLAVWAAFCAWAGWRLRRAGTARPGAEQDHPAVPDG